MVTATTIIMIVIVIVAINNLYLINNFIHFYQLL